MPPRDRGQRRPHGPPGQDANDQLPWAIVYYKTPDGTVPALEFLDVCPRTVDAQFTAVLDAVAAAPPPRFSGGGKWEAMHGTMGGWYEIRLTGPGREQLRLFCLLENGTSDELARRGLPRPAIAVITGMCKPWGQCSPSATTSACGNSAANTSKTTRVASRPRGPRQLMTNGRSYLTAGSEEPNQEPK
jgi:hypothetical protein